MIKTDKFIIRHITPKDMKGLYAVFDDFAQGKYRMYDYPVLLTKENVARLTLAFSLQEHFYAVFTPDDKEMMGYISFDGEGDEYEMGYCFHSRYHRKGIAYSACTEIMNYIKREYVVRKFIAGTALDNIPSVKLLEKLGFELVGTETFAFHKDDSGNNLYFTGGNFEKY